MSSLNINHIFFFFFFSSRRRHTRLQGDWSSRRVLFRSVVTTTGRRSGRPRPAQLIGIPVHDDLALIGSNFGQRHTPTWVLNLEADPRATVAHRDVTVDVVARPAGDEERSEILVLAGRVYPGYPKYFDRVSDRQVRVFVLEKPSRD